MTTTGSGSVSNSAVCFLQTLCEQKDGSLQILLLGRPSLAVPSHLTAAAHPPPGAAAAAGVCRTCRDQTNTWCWPGDSWASVRHWASSMFVCLLSLLWMFGSDGPMSNTQCYGKYLAFLTALRLNHLISLNKAAECWIHPEQIYSLLMKLWTIYREICWKYKILNNQNHSIIATFGQIKALYSILFYCILLNQ